MRDVILILISTVLFSCSSSKCDRTSNSKAINYKLSKNYELSFGVAGSSYSILYKDSIPIDTIWMYSNIHKIGLDSMLYMRVRASITNDYGDPKDFKNNMIIGDIQNLTLYNGCDFVIIKPPLFHTYFSSFNYKDYYIYYWGLEDFKTYACRYNIKSKKFNKIELPDNELETDYFGVLHPPKFVDSGILFESEIKTNSWVINMSFDNILNDTKQQPDTIVVEKNDTIK